MKYLRFRMAFILALSLIFSCATEASNSVVNEGVMDDATLDKEQILSAKIELSNETDFSSVLAITYSINKATSYNPDNITLLLSSENVFTGVRETVLVFDVNFLF